MTMRFSRLIPFVFFFILAIILTKGLWHNPRLLLSTRIGKPVPEFNLAALDATQPMVKSIDMRGNITLINVWGSWCPACRAEHPFLMTLKQNPRFNLVGIAYKDNIENTTSYLEKSGNPYAQIGVDADSRTAIDLGVTAVPETFLVDAKGIVRLRVTGGLSPQAWAEQVEPILTKLEAE